MQFLYDPAPGIEALDYEFPFNERMRVLMRLEELFDRFDFFLVQEDAMFHHAALMILFEIIEIGGRNDMRHDLAIEIDRLQNIKTAENPDQQAFIETLKETLSNITRMQGRLAQHLRENEWLMNIRSRSSIPGGVSSFDLPGYHAWKQQSPQLRRQLLQHWTAANQPIVQATRLLLNLLRERAIFQAATAEAGVYSETLQGKQALILRVRVPAHSPAIPELSANKQSFWLRFHRAHWGQDSGQGSQPKHVLFDQPLTFDYAICWQTADT